MAPNGGSWVQFDMSLNAGDVKVIRLHAVAVSTGLTFAIADINVRELARGMERIIVRGVLEFQPAESEEE